MSTHLRSSFPLIKTALFAVHFAWSCDLAQGQVLGNHRKATSSDYVDKLPADKKSAMVVITGDRSTGTGFFASVKDNVFLVTNMHVISGQSSIRATTMDGTDVQIAGIFGAQNADIALLKLNSVPSAFFETEQSVNTAHKTGDFILVPGNSLGGGTILQTEGKIVGIGPAKIEHDAPTFHGNSGSPILSTRTWKVLGVDTESITVSLSDKSDSASARNAGSQIKSTVRLFGYRLDSVAQWEAIEWTRFAQQSKKLEDADALVTAVHAIIKRDTSGWKKHPSTNSYMSSLGELVNKPRVSPAEVTAKVETIVLNLRNALKRVELDALESKRNCYGYISLRYQDLGMYAKAVREFIDADKIR
ncbi:serine protease [Prosthecobacter sp.]|uniref:serine protease n=1 Tax=Prosthecobacter sp. TaxID=1965333 RepID=UPI0037835AC7